MEILKAFHGKKEIKKKYIDRVKAHQKADEIIKGRYWENGKGCAVGCTVEVAKNAHDQYPIELGISWRIALIEDSIFENIPNGEAKKFPLQFLQAVPVGADTELVYKKFVMWVLGDKKTGLMYVVKSDEAKGFLKRVYDLYERSLKEVIEQKEWKKLADEAYYASASASASASAYASAYASASASASAYASAYAYASASASASAYASAYALPEWQKIFDKRILQMRDKLLSLLKKAK